MLLFCHYLPCIDIRHMDVKRVIKVFEFCFKYYHLHLMLDLDKLSLEVGVKESLRRNWQGVG